MLIDGKAIANNMLAELKIKVKKLNTPPTLAVVFVGSHKASKTYIKRKREAAEMVGINFELHQFPGDIKEETLIKEIQTIQKDKALSGLIVQLPLPEHLFTTNVLNAIKPELDVDCLTDYNLGKLIMKTATILPPTPAAVLRILKELNVDLHGKHITIIGTGALVGKPLAVMLMNKFASITTVNKETKDVKKKCKAADIIVTGVGKKDLLRGNMVKKGAIVIDTGICFEGGKMYGDANMKEVSKKASYVTPTPGGVGPITVAILLENTLKLHTQK